MLTKVAIFAILAFVIYFMLKAKFNSKKEQNAGQNDEKTELIECQNCRIFVSANELKNGLCAECRAKKGQK